MGNRQEARELVHHILAEYPFATEGEYVPVQLLANLLEATVLVGDVEAVTILLPLLKPLPPMPMASSFARTCPSRHLGEAAALLGDLDEARTYFNDALEVCAKIGFRPEIALTRLGLAELLLEHYPDERATAMEHLDFAIGEFREMKMQPSLERALRHRELLKA
jgi:hypothetical protein